MAESATVVVRTKRHSPEEERVAQVLRHQLAQFDVSSWQFTSQVVVDERAIPHSHPVLTISTRPILRTELGVLAGYLHEQIHWQLSRQRRDVRHARRDLRGPFPKAKTRREGGARTRRNTYLHLLVNWLELAGIQAVAGRAAAVEVCTAASAGPVYPWIYQQVASHWAGIDEIIRRHNLLGPLAGRHIHPVHPAE